MSFQNWHKEVDKFWLKHWKVSKIYTLMGYFWPKYIIFGLRMYRGVIFDGTQDWYKVWRKTNLSFQKWHKEFGKFFTRALESLKTETLMAFFCLKLKMHELKIYSGLDNDNEEWCKIWRGIDLSVQNWHNEFDEFSPKHSKTSNICTLIGCFWPKYIKFELKKVQRIYVWWYWRLMQNLKEKPTWTF